VNAKENIWCQAYRLLREIDTLQLNDPARNIKILACREWLACQSSLPRLRALAALMKPWMSRRELWNVLVPVERSVSRLRVTDVDILQDDLPQRRSRAEQMPLKIVVDSLRSAFNTGALLRSSECFGADEVILCGYTPVPGHTQVARAALGCDKLVKWRYGADIRAVIRELQAAKITCYALETVADAPLIDSVDWRFPAALVVGNERFGLDPDVVRLCNGGAVRIRLYGAKNSLNVVSAFSIAVYEMRRCFEKLSGGEDANSCG
jgi:23S rRNA (guanosine2251-2'-O)-methyltransferase